MLPEEMVEASVRETIWDPVPVRRCWTCEKWFPETVEFFYDKGERLDRHCRKCAAARRRELAAQNRARVREIAKASYERLKADPVRLARLREKRREANRRRRERERTDPVFAERQRELRRAAAQRRKLDPDRYQQYLENRRIRESIKRRAKGAPAVPQRSVLGSVVDRERRTYLPVGPLRDYLVVCLAESGLTHEVFATSVGLHPRALTRILREGARVQRDLADRITSHLPILLGDLYPDAADEAQAA